MLGLRETKRNQARELKGNMDVKERGSQEQCEEERDQGEAGTGLNRKINRSGQMERRDGKEWREGERKGGREDVNLDSTSSYL